MFRNKEAESRSDPANKGKSSYRRKGREQRAVVFHRKACGANKPTRCRITVGQTQGKGQFSRQNNSPMFLPPGIQGEGVVG